MRTWLVALLMLGLLAPGVSLAQDGASDPPMNAPEGNEGEAMPPEASSTERYGGAEATHSVNATARFNLLPDAVLDIWFDLHGSLWQDQSNMGFGLEYTWRKLDSFDVVVAVIWSDFSMPSQYWLEADKNTPAADWTTNSLSTLAIEARIYGYYNFIKELGIYYGAGIWLGAILGEMTSIDSGCAQRTALADLGNCPHPGTEVEEEDIPPVFGFVNVSAGLRAEIEDMIIIKVEGGFQAYFYVGLSLGVQFF